jgi:hypothetical protein
MMYSWECNGICVYITAIVVLVPWLLGVKDIASVVMAWLP